MNEQQDSSDATGKKVFLGTVLHFLKDPQQEMSSDSHSSSAAWQWFEEGALVVDENGLVEWVGPKSQIMNSQLLHDATVVDRTCHLILPGFIDTHIHSPQVDAIGCYGEQLLDWLQKYVFPAEKMFSDRQFAEMMSGFFLDLLLAAGTTTACVHTTVHMVSCDAFFNQARIRSMRMNAGKVLMNDPNTTPDYLRDNSVDEGIQQSKQLISGWHNQYRMTYMVTPRFGLSCTPEMMKAAGQLFQDNVGKRVAMQTHLSENWQEQQDTIDKFRNLGVPNLKTYYDVYRHYDLIGPRALYAHCIHLSPADQQHMGGYGSGNGGACAHCPTSNFFLGSGLCDVAGFRDARVRVGIGTDCGAGTHYSILHTLNEAYKVSILREGLYDWADMRPIVAGDHTTKPRDPAKDPGQVRRLTAWRAFYFATLGGAEALYLDDKIGNFELGKEADFIILDWAATPVLKRRSEVSEDPHNRLFGLMTLGDDRAVKETYIMGKLRWQRDVGVIL